MLMVQERVTPVRFWRKTYIKIIGARRETVIPPEKKNRLYWPLVFLIPVVKTDNEDNVKSIDKDRVLRNTATAAAMNTLMNSFKN
ncbi:hypothetical protein KUTeg_017562 [Tegillarca granosa]|uniref:Uncharacterized protein n=1 Tax=Tegillarca granosa TaxID=220873 RepID=A0ABQ9EFA2_TEGGR|nr:hypothetical protein KUTeg_017562 [Tegillarca granosa]